MDNPHTQSQYATKTECILAREKWYQERIKKLEKAVEFAGYMATSAENYQAACNKFDEADEAEDDDAIEDASLDCNFAFRCLTSNIYEFRKRIPK